MDSDAISTIAAPGAEQAGLIVDSVEIVPPGTRRDVANPKVTTVVVAVDLPEDRIGSAGIDEIASATRAISKALDAANLPFPSYTLEVGTPGTDRPLTERRHFMRARTREVEVVTIAGEKVSGVLEDVDGDTLVFAGEGGSRVALTDVASGRLSLPFAQIDEE